MAQEKTEDKAAEEPAKASDAPDITVVGAFSTDEILHVFATARMIALGQSPLATPLLLFTAGEFALARKQGIPKEIIDRVRGALLENASGLAQKMLTAIRKDIQADDKEPCACEGCKLVKQITDKLATLDIKDEAAKKFAEQLTALFNNNSAEDDEEDNDDGETESETEGNLDVN